MSNPGRQSLMVPSAVTPRASMSLSPDPSDLRKTNQSVILIFSIVHCPIIIPTKEKLKGSWLLDTLSARSVYEPITELSGRLPLRSSNHSHLDS